jgi:hypothetical protein
MEFHPSEIILNFVASVKRMFFLEVAMLGGLSSCISTLHSQVIGKNIRRIFYSGSAQK